MKQHIKGMDLGTERNFAEKQSLEFSLRTFLWLGLEGHHCSNKRVGRGIGGEMGSGTNDVALQKASPLRGPTTLHYSGHYEFSSLGPGRA